MFQKKSNNTSLPPFPIVNTHKTHYFPASSDFFFIFFFFFPLGVCARSGVIHQTILNGACFRRKRVEVVCYQPTRTIWCFSFFGVILKSPKKKKRTSNSTTKKQDSRIILKADRRRLYSYH